MHKKMHKKTMVSNTTIKLSILNQIKAIPLVGDIAMFLIIHNLVSCCSRSECCQHPAAVRLSGFGLPGVVHCRPLYHATAGDINYSVRMSNVNMYHVDTACVLQGY